MHTLSNTWLLQLIIITILGLHLLPVTLGSGDIGSEIGVPICMQTAIKHPKARTVINQFRGGKENTNTQFGGGIQDSAILPGYRFGITDIELGPLARGPFFIIHPIPMGGGVITQNQISARRRRREVPSV